jgi:hypothetical protein
MAAIGSEMKVMAAKISNNENENRRKADIKSGGMAASKSVKKMADGNQKRIMRGSAMYQKIGSEGGEMAYRNGEEMAKAERRKLLKMKWQKKYSNHLAKPASASIIIEKHNETGGN